MRVARIKSSHTDATGRLREYESAYLRRTYREAGKVKHETLADLSGLCEQTVASIEVALKGTALVPAGQAMTIHRSVLHGHVAAVHAMAVQLGPPALLGPAYPQRDLALALVISRAVTPASKLATLTRWADTTLGTDLGTPSGVTEVVERLLQPEPPIEVRGTVGHLARQARDALGLAMQMTGLSRAPPEPVGTAAEP